MCAPNDSNIDHRVLRRGSIYPLYNILRCYFAENTNVRRFTKPALIAPDYQKPQVQKGGEVVLLLRVFPEHDRLRTLE